MRPKLERNVEQKEQRRRKILEYLADCGPLGEQSIRDCLQVCIHTIRKDLKVLQARGAVRVQFARWGSKIWSITLENN